MRKIKELIIHTTATADGWMADNPVADKVEEITRWHKKRGWRTIGYHRIIDRDGSVGMGRSYVEIGAHVKGRNANSIGISLVGGKTSNENDKFSDNFTEAQRKALWKFIDDLRTDFGNIKISGHNEYAAKACPGFQVSEFLAERQAKPLPAKTLVVAAGFGLVGAGGGIYENPEYWPVAALVGLAVIGFIIWRIKR